MKPRKEEPKCFHGFEHANDGQCYLKTEASTFATAFAKCWAGWPIQPEILEPKSLSYWFQNSRDGIYKIQSTASGFVWLPFRHFNKDTPLLNPPWSWNAVSNRWVHQVNELDIRADNNSDGEELCAAYDLTRNRMVTRSCQDYLPMICSRPALPPNISSIISSQPDHTGEYFCEQGWITHFLVMDAGMCYRRFTLKEAVDADGAQQFCIKQGGHLAVAPTHNMRIALEQVYGFFNNQSIVDSWIGLRNRGEHPVTFNWVNQTAGVSTSTALNWQPYQEFGSGYGVSTGLTRAWWNWPRETKIWGVLCQKTVSDWQDGIGLQLEKLSVNEYALVFTYDQRHYGPPGEQYSHVSKTFWQSDFDVICHFNNYAMHFRFPLDRQYYRVLVPGSMGSGRLICEGWLNRPTLRFQSNTVIHRPTYDYDSEEYKPYP
ncbi:hypothetical protein DAPPUDRAFT_301668 [Daphnia pulex]|uniref:C-type lectin domain-containing protein n=1 Tax=Daphnia pulex TaxID=6669 RepID=E9GAB1_DAPPU|nr:hypothetical protein DAPPUDRAFT_301668 [Daphnia pulex]|eukprot:EFX83740.1 hypothetical protein DAPPUDRAFT_301668 [Daphnia pulex]